MKTSLLNNFKKTLFIFGIITLIALEASAQNEERIRFVFGTRSKPAAQGDGCDGEKGICIRLLAKTTIIDKDLGVGEFQIVRGQLQLNIVSDPSPAGSDENTFYIYEDRILPAETAEELGYSKIIIRKGEYRLDKSKNRLGTVLLNASFY
jgi:hypothetical protein